MAGTIFLIAGPSGSGKTTLTQELVHCVPGLTKAVTVTTRQPRPGEISGVDYHFVSTKRFREMRQGGELIESDCAYNEHYGVPRTYWILPGTLPSSSQWMGPWRCGVRGQTREAFSSCPLVQRPRRRGSRPANARTRISGLRDTRPRSWPRVISTTSSSISISCKAYASWKRSSWRGGNLALTLAGTRSVSQDRESIHSPTVT